jgi:hypothetical protein
MDIVNSFNDIKEPIAQPVNSNIEFDIEYNIESNIEYKNYIINNDNENDIIINNTYIKFLKMCKGCATLFIGNLIIYSLVILIIIIISIIYLLDKF